MRFLIVLLLAIAAVAVGKEVSGVGTVNVFSRKTVKGKTVPDRVLLEAEGRLYLVDKGDSALRSYVGWRIAFTGKSFKDTSSVDTSLETIILRSYSPQGR